MFGIVNFGAFITAALILNITPGADTIYILSKSAVGGRRQGVASTLGVSTGILVHTVLAAFGLSAILAASTVAFNVVKMLGAAYLIFLGVRTIIKKEPLFAKSQNGGESFLKVYGQGVLTNVLNPKAALFFLTLLPQYVSPDSTYGPLPFLLLGLTFVCTSTCWCLVLAYFSSFISGLLSRSERVGSIANKVSGCVYIALGLNVLRANSD